MPAQHAGTSFSEPIDLIEDIPIASSMPSRKDPGRDGRTKVHTPASSRVAPYPASSVGRRRTAISASSPSARGHRTSEPSPSQSLKRQALSRQPREALSSGEGSPSEKRVRRFRPSCPQAFHEIYERATTQRFYVLERYRVGTPQCPEEIVELTGSTGSIYLVHITKQPKCTCPHAEKGNQCKHMVYVLAKVLNAPFELVYQLALLSTELQQIFANSPPISAPPEAKTEDKNRKPIDGDCPICFSELDATGGESVVWCRAACGQNMHRDCFGLWAKSKAGETTCPFCRSIWEGNKDLVDTKKIDRSRGLIEDGYINIRDQLPGVSRFRDESTYSSWSPYMRRHRWENEW